MIEKVNTPGHQNLPHNLELDGHKVQGKSVPGHHLHSDKDESNTTANRNSSYTGQDQVYIKTSR